MEYTNNPLGATKAGIRFNHAANVLRTWWSFHVKWPWVKYRGFIRVGKHTSFARLNVELGDRVQFGPYCEIAAPVKIGDSVLFGANCHIVGKHDHTTDVPGHTIWDGERQANALTVIGNDVWIGNGTIIVSDGLSIGDGAVVGAGSVVTGSIPPMEVWAGNPARKIRDRFPSPERAAHQGYLDKTFKVKR